MLCVEKDVLCSSRLLAEWHKLVRRGHLHARGLGYRRWLNFISQCIDPSLLFRRSPLDSKYVELFLQLCMSMSLLIFLPIPHSCSFQNQAKRTKLVQPQNEKRLVHLESQNLRLDQAERFAVDLH